ncbi:hypothetical protein GEMRC1_011795 [Eukaryota sp. GEM-RC1]
MGRSKVRRFPLLSLNLTRGEGAVLAEFLAGRLTCTTKDADANQHQLLELQRELKSRNKQYDSMVNSFKQEIDTLKSNHDTSLQQNFIQLLEKESLVLDLQ